MPGPDVLIIGAGIIGVTCAEALARAGLRVLLLDRDRALKGCTAAGGGMLTLQTKPPGEATRLARHSIALLREAEERYESDIGLRWCGSMVLAQSATEMTHLEARAAELAGVSVDIHLLGGPEARAAEPALFPGILGASLCDTDGQVDPLLYGRAALGAALRSGAELREGTAVQEIAIARRHATGVRTPGGVIEASAVLVTAGAWSAQMLGASDASWATRIIPRRGVLLRSSPQPPLARRALLEASYYSQKRSAPEESFAFSLQQLVGGCLLLGGSRSFSGFYNRPPTEQERRAILARAAEFVPGLARIAFPNATAGLRPWTPDALPLVGPTGIDGLWLAAGHEGDGIAMAAVTAEVTAARIIGGSLPPDAATLDPGRFLSEP